MCDGRWWLQGGNVDGVELQHRGQAFALGAMKRAEAFRKRQPGPRSATASNEVEPVYVEARESTAIFATGVGSAQNRT